MRWNLGYRLALASLWAGLPVAALGGLSRSPLGVQLGASLWGSGLVCITVIAWLVARRDPSVRTYFEAQILWLRLVLGWRTREILLSSHVRKRHNHTAEDRSVGTNTNRHEQDHER